MKNEIAQVQALLSCNPPQPDDAIRLLKNLPTSKQSNSWIVYYFFGIAYMQKNEFVEAVTVLEKSLRNGGKGIEVLQLLAEAYTKAGKFEQAEELIKQILAEKEDHVASWKNLGHIYYKQDKYEEAIRVLGKANNFSTSDLSIAVSIGKVYFKLGDYREALNTYESILKVNSGYIDAHFGVVSVLMKKKEFVKAKQILHVILQHFPGHKKALRLVANCAVALGDYENSLEVFEQILQQEPNDVDARLGYAQCISDLGFYDEAEIHFKQAIQDGADPDEVVFEFLNCVLHNPAYSKVDVGEWYLDFLQKYPRSKNNSERPVLDDDNIERRLHIGFISDSFQNLPEGRRFKALIEHLPKHRFRFFCYNTANQELDAVSEQISAHCSRFTFVSTVSPSTLAGHIRFDQIDILVDMSTQVVEKIHKTLMEKPAPVIMKWKDAVINPYDFGEVNFLISKQGEEPSEQVKKMGSNFLFLPETARIYVPPVYPNSKNELPASSNGFITFGNFSTPKAINTQVLQSWAHILRQVTGSRLLLIAPEYSSTLIRNNIIAQLKELGVTEDRVHVAASAIHLEALKAFKQIDIVLDTFPISSDQLVGDALWMGVPVCTMKGAFSSDVAVQYLQSVGLQHLVALHWPQYVANAIDLAGHTKQLVHLRQTLREKLMESPMGDAQRYAAHFSEALVQIWEQRQKANQENVKERKWQHDITISALAHTNYSILSAGSGSSPARTVTSSEKVFTPSFWESYPNKEKIDKVVKITNRFFNPNTEESFLAQIVTETAERLKEAPTDNVAFFIQARALRAIKPENAIIATQCEALDEALQQKGWWKKRAIYSYWFDKVERLKELPGTQVSAIIISNKFKEKSVENLKRLREQLQGIGEIIFVNNGLDDAKFTRLMPYVTTYVKANGNAGAYLARNLGAIFAQGKHLIFVDDDGIPDKDFINAHLKEHNQRDLVVSRGMYYSNNIIDDPWHYNIGNVIKPAFTILEGNAMYKAEAFYTASGWGDYILFGHGGKDLSYRLLEFYPDKEQQIYIPGSRLNHEYFRGSDHKSEKKLKQLVSHKLLESLHPRFAEIIDQWPTSFRGNTKALVKRQLTGTPLVKSHGKQEQFIHFCRNHVYAQVLSDLVEEINQTTNQQHWLLIEKSHWKAGDGYSIDASENPHTLFFDSLNKSELDLVLKTGLNSNVTAIFMHGIFRPWEYYLLNKIGGKKHIGWVIWGGDLYHPIQRGTPKHFHVDKISSIHTLGEGDIELFLKTYGPREVIRFGYPYPGLYGTLITEETEKKAQIIVGNSGDPSNGHLEILEMLEAKADIADYEILLPVAYNLHKEYEAYLNAWIQRSSLKEQVTLQKQFLTPEQYFKLISSSHMLITAHQRQQAVGNMLMATFSGRLTVMRDRIHVNGEEITNPSWEFFMENELDVTRYDDVKNAPSIAALGQVSNAVKHRHQTIIKEKFGLQVKAKEIAQACEELAEMINEKVM